MPLQLPPKEVHLWYTRLEHVGSSCLLEKYRRWMTPDERARYDRFRSPSAQRGFLVTRGLVRAVLSRYQETEPEAWKFRMGLFGKPEIEAPHIGAGLRFNLSNADGLVACAVAIDRDIGVDVEAIDRPLRGLAIADRFFSPLEITALRSLPREQQREAFFEYWTLKESYIKARGLGLSIALDKFSFTLRRGAPATIAIDPVLEDDPARWRFLQLRPTNRHMIAVAVSETLSAASGLPSSPLDLVVRSVVP
ncbi:MAG: 4-phosphopantetheinyl transferase [Bradyrhizobium sp.]|jgi:4'-phosphopantetheinyl transferase|nr:4-phosphopantetheinyl transferase [Bradyrhizobium sp.]